MKRFAALFAELDASTSNARKHAALLAYLRDTAATHAAEDAAWGLWFLAGGKPKQLVPTAVLRAALLQRTGLAEWLFDECYAQVGDLAETLSLLLPAPTADAARGLSEWMHAQLLPLRGLPPAEQIARLHAQWEGLSRDERLLHGKLITGGFRVGVSKQGVINALAEHAGLDAKSLAQRFVGFTNSLPTAERLAALTAAGEHEEPGRPYPFFLAHPLASLEPLGDAADWIAEWKWDGIRAQWIRRAGQVFVWSRGEELISERFPELLALPLPEGTVIDGELVIWHQGRVQPFQHLQQRIQRKALSPKLLREAPAALIAYDLLELNGDDQRTLPQHARRVRLEALLAAHPHPALHLSERVDGDWPQRAAARSHARERGAEGLMLKHRDAAYGVGRSKADGQWLKWKLDPYTVDAVLLYAQKGHGRRANLYSDYSFGVWNADRTQLLPFAKAYSGLSDAEMAQVDARIRATTVESFGPVRSVKPTLVVELGFEGIGASPRHKSGIAVRFPRMLRLRWDKPVEEADTLDTLKALL